MCEDYAELGGMIIVGLILLVATIYGLYRLCKSIKKRIDVGNLLEYLISQFLEFIVIMAVGATAVSVFFGLAWCIGYLACLIMAL
jgi:p-aminobenzoyl-glutamate transporter AbgT